MGLLLAVLLGVARTGAVHVVATDSVCQNTRELRVSEISSHGKRQVVAFQHSGDCDRMIGGLPPGSYEISFHTDDRPFASTSVQIAAQAVATATILVCCRQPALTWLSFARVLRYWGSKEKPALGASRTRSTGASKEDAECSDSGLGPCSPCLLISG
jgi:hypothetical protein